MVCQIADFCVAANDYIRLTVAALNGL